MGSVLNGERYVTDEVRRRVLEAAEGFGYRSNNAARALASGRTRTIGVVALGTALYGPASLLIGIDRAVGDAGYALRMVSTFKGDQGGVAGAVESLLEQGVGGIVVSVPIDEGVVSLGVGVSVPVPGPPAAFGGTRAVATGVDAPLLARVATEHLSDLGYMTGRQPAEKQRWFAARDRLAGRRGALTAHGREQPPVLVGDWPAAPGYAAGRELACDSDVTAVFAADDDLALGRIRALTDVGRRVPDAVRVVGFDDIPVAALVNPPLPRCASRTTLWRARDCGSWYRPSRNRTCNCRRRTIRRSDSSCVPRPHPRRCARPRGAGRGPAPRSLDEAHAPPAADSPPTTS
ncbi:LacI family DNA-binding transcriptional regulator [Streptomyces bullii]